MEATCDGPIPRISYLGGQSLRAVTARYVAADSAGAVEWSPYNITRDSVAASQTHATATVTDAGGIGAKTWNFSTAGGSTPAWQIGLLSEFVQKASTAGTTYTNDTFTWAQNAGSHPYMTTKIAVTDPGTGNAQTAKTTQTQDQYGNTTQMVIFPYNNTTTPLKTFNSTFLSDSTHVQNYLLGLLASTTLTTGGTTKTLVTNGYDAGNCGTSAGGTPINLFDSSAVPFNQRGLLNTTTTLAGTACTSYYSYGSLYHASDSNGASVTSSQTAATNYAAPVSISTATYSESLGYNSWLGLVQTTGLNGEQLLTSYDSCGRPSTSTSPFGAVTVYGIAGPTVQTKQGPDGWTQTTRDGLGHTVKVERGPNWTSVQSVVDSVYAPCACSPLGKLQKVSMPHTPGDPNVKWTVYTYDGLGRTVSVVQPGGASTTTYGYAGNTTR